jgi:hypothetical protein
MKNEKMQYPKEISTHGVLFPKLTTIHLHDLPKLQQICGVKMVAPMLKSIRGCWSLCQLPSVGARGRGERKPAVAIKKDVWDVLEWDADHRHDHFKMPVHSCHYKEKLPRVSVLSTSRKRPICPGSRGPLAPVLEPGLKGRD